MRKSTMTLVAVLVGLILVTPFLTAQIRESGAIQGNITDDKGEALPGATVTISGSKLIGGAKTYITDKNGYYRFPALPTGPYTVAVELPGFATMVREVTQLTADMTLSVDFKLTQASVKEEIVVKANAPTIDVKSSAPGGVVMTEEFLKSVPYTKSILAVIELAPGVDTDLQSAYGSGSLMNNSWSIDGINTAETLMGKMHFQPDYNIIKEASVRGLGLPAEYGEYTGTTVNVITKSGSNKFTGLAEFRFHGKGWNSQNLTSRSIDEYMYPEQMDDKFNTGDSYDGSFQLGGKLIQDKLWFFLSGEYSLANTYSPGISYHKQDKNPKTFVKLDYQLDNRNRLQVSFIWQKNIRDNYALSNQIPEELSPTAVWPRFSVSGSWTSQFSENTILDVKLGYYSQKETITPGGGMDTPAIRDYYYNSYTDNYDYYSKMDEHRDQFTAHLSHYIADFYGSHDIKIGGEVQYAKHGSESGLPGGMAYYYYNGEPEELDVQDATYLDYYARTISAFVQDSWTIGKRLTINAGLRLNNYWFKNPASDIGVLYDSTSLAPRIGFAYDIMGDRKNVLKFHYGHYSDALRIDGLNQIESRNSTFTAYMWDGTQWVENYSYNDNSSGYSVDPKAKQPYMEEYVAGFERELFKNASLEINAYYRKGKNFLGAVLTGGGSYYLSTATCYGEDGVLGTSDDYTIPYYAVDYDNYVEPSYTITNVKKGLTDFLTQDPSRVSKGVEVIFNKRMSNRWQLLVAYNYGTSRGNSSSLWTDLGSYPNLLTFANGKMYYYGEPHHFRIQGSVLLPWDILLGFTGSYMSGVYEETYGYVDTPNGMDFMVVKAVGDGKRDEARKNFDLRVEKQFELGGSKRVSISVDMMNVFNFDGAVYYRFYGPYYGKINYLQDPRQITVSARFWF